MIDPETGDPVIERYFVKLFSGGAVVFDGSIDTDPVQLADEGPGSLEVQDAGGVVFRGDVGRDDAGAPTIASLSVGNALFENGDRSVTVASADFRGGLDASDALELRGLGLDSSLRFGGDVGLASAPTRFDADADLLLFDGADRLEAGEVLLNTATPAAAVPLRATVADTGGGLRIDAAGDVALGANEKLSSIGVLRIRTPGEVRLGDVNATRIDIEAQQVTLQGRDPAPLELADGSQVVDGGAEWVANDIRSSAGLEWDGVGAPPILVLGGGTVQMPGGSPFPVIWLDDDFGRVSGERLTGENGILDLTGSGPLVAADPGEDQPRPAPDVVAVQTLRSSGTPPELPDAPGAQSVLEVLRCRSAEVPAPCPLPEGEGPDSALASERAREIVLRYRDLVTSQRGRIALVSAFAPLAGAEDDSAALASLLRDASLGPARSRLDELARVLAQVSLLGLEEEDTAAVRRALAADFAAATGVARLGADGVLSAVDARGVGALP